ncbi:MAG: hypothetical protein K9J16_14155 [Melioribacteraceae bacterium]|nr:hypothetical protein [Melioribacteraceae bacterium]MCF8355662.1 hypothetical protein [Melioribacteraceae bacterium]MCF8395136.1 hypothetical protein [Melioribacteraceae bacterium]MCF8420570.1 hypothetical protein [Melioribacteraceae bacterium]
MKFIKKILLILILVNPILFAQLINFGEARGLFMGVGVGPRIPVGDFSENQNIGIGTDITFSYTDNKLLPVFFYSKIEYQHYPGRQILYKNSDYASLSSNVIGIHAGVRYFFKPFLENIVLLMPVLEGGLSFTFWEKSHLFKSASGRKNYVEDVLKSGFHIGAGFSMFLLDAIAYYNYFPANQFISLTLRVRIPIFVTI